MDAKTIFDHIVNAFSALEGEAPRDPRPAKIPKLKPLQFSGPSCCVAKRPAVGTGKLPQVRKPSGDK